MTFIKIQFVSFSNNFAIGLFEIFVIKLLSKSVPIDISSSFFFSNNFNFNILILFLFSEDFISSDGNTLIKSKIHNLSSKFNNFLFSLLFILLLIVIELSDSPLKKKKFP